MNKTTQANTTPENSPIPKCDMSNVTCRYDSDFYTEEGRENFIKHHGENLSKLVKPRISVKLHGAILDIFPGKET